MRTLDIVGREAKHLAYSHSRLFEHQIDADWVAGSVGRAQDVPDNFIPPNTLRYSELRAVSRGISAHGILGKPF